MGRDEVFDKLNIELKKDIVSESQVVYILSRIRKYIEINNIKNDFKLLNFCCDWALHFEMNRTNKLDDNLKSRLTNRDEFFSFFDLFKKDLSKFLEKYDLDIEIITNREKFEGFIALLLSIYSDTPLIINYNNKYKITIIKSVDLSIKFGYKVDIVPISDKKRSIEELENALIHIGYERDMLKHIAIVYKYNKELFKPIFINNLLTDSFAIHLRNMIYFLINVSPQEDDIVVQDFIDKCKLQIKGEAKNKFKSNYQKANKLAAHLTYSRINYGKGNNVWEVEQIYNDISLKFNEFVDIYNKSKQSAQKLLDKLPFYEELKDELYDDLYDEMYYKLKFKLSKNVIYKSPLLNEESNVSQLYDVVDNSDDKSKPNTEVAALVSTPFKHKIDKNLEDESII